MKQERVEKIISDMLPDADIEVEGKDCNFTVTIISDSLKDLTLLQRQQKVLAGFRTQLAEGSLHALTIRAYTLEEWNARTNHLVQISL